MATTYDKASLVMIPSGYKDDKLYAVKPTDGSGDFTFSRDGAGASPATRVNASGLIEKGRENILTYSNDFSNAAWSRVGASPTSGQSGYDGSSDAWLLSATGAGAHYALQSKADTNIHTFSIYAKQGTSKGIRIAVNGGGDHWANFNLDLGTQIGTAASVVDTEITSVGGGWYRISVTANKTGSGWGVVYILDNSFNTSFTASGETIYIQDAQLESGLVATDYIETTTAPVSAGLLGDMPRLDYSGGASCPSLLLEPSRSNLLPHSEYIDDSGWTKSNATITTNHATSAEGVQNASLVTFGSGGYILESVTTTKTIGSTETISVFSNADISGTFLKYGGGTAAGTDVEDREVIGNGWYRYYVTRTFTEAETGSTQLLIAQSNVGDSVLIYGAQLEVGSYPTSYIPTYGSASTRGADSCSKTGISSLIGQTEGTLFLETTDWQLSLDTLLFSVSDGSTSNYIQISTNSVTGNLQSVIFAGGGGTLLGSTTPTAGQRLKIAVGYKVNDYVFYVNGTQIGTLTSKAAPSSLTRSDIGSLSWIGSGLQPRPKIAQALVFPTRLTNAELAALTTI